MNSETTFDALDETPELLRGIEPSRCLAPDGGHSYGRLATVVAGEPVLAVVNHVVDGGDIYIRTCTDARLARLTAGGRAAHAVFQVDSAFAAGQSRWSVTLSGNYAVLPARRRGTCLG